MEIVRVGRTFGEEEMKNIVTLFWLATWTAQWMEQSVCEQKIPPEPNKYTGEFQANYYVNALLCSTVKEKSMSKCFSRKEEAESFFDECDSGPVVLSRNPVCVDIKIVKVPKCL